ncbi:GGDEF domain-containing protein, partial [Lonsdalea britannica]
NKNELQLRWMADNIAAIAVNFLVLISLVLLGTFVLKQIRITVRNKEMLSMMHREVEDQNQVLQELALVDPLTQLANRRRFDLYLEQCLTTAGVEGGDVALAMIDVDFFKRYNDTYGHIEGDRCLAEIGLILRSLPLPAGAQPARYGGEEFSIILPGLSGRQAELVGNEMVEAMRTRAIKHQGSQLPQKIVTVSVGVYSYTSKHPCDAQRLKEGADQALYLAKKKGRNQCIRL